MLKEEGGKYSLIKGLDTREAISACAAKTRTHEYTHTNWEEEGGQSGKVKDKRDSVSCRLEPINCAQQVSGKLTRG